jgi:predicted deacylase
MNKATIIGALLTLGVVLLAVVAFWPTTLPAPEPLPEPAVEEVIPPTPTSTVSVIGTSVQGRDITAHTFGTGETDILFVGGIHGGYEANTVGLAEGVIEELHVNQMVVPENITVHVIPNLNPDGYALPADSSDFDRRMNANGVDLNRNFDCRWTPESTWRTNPVSGGTEPFSEPEAIALRDYVTEHTPIAAVVWHSRANAVYTSECGAGVVAGGNELMNAYAAAATYDAAGLWTAYPVTGASEDWFASIGIPAITVEFETRDSIEWTRNWAGVLATLELFTTE